MPRQNKPKINLPIRVTVGISLHRGQSDVDTLVRRLLQQHQDNFILERIIVVSDLSQSHQNLVINGISDPRVILVTDFHRGNKSQYMNKIFRYFTNDILVVFDSDTLPHSRFTLSDLIRPFTGKDAGKLGLVMSKPILQHPESLRDFVMYHAHNLHHDMGISWDFAAKVYSGLLASQIIWTEEISEPELIQKHLHKNKLVQLFSTAQVLVSPSGYSKVMPKIIGDLNKKTKVKIVLKHFFTHPIWISAYLIQLSLTKLGHHLKSKFYLPHHPSYF